MNIIVLRTLSVSVYAFINSKKFHIKQTYESDEMKVAWNEASNTVGVQLYGSFQNIMMLPPPSFGLATNWLLEVLWTPQKRAAVNLPIQKHHILSLGLTFDIPWLANWRQQFFGRSKALPRLGANLVGAASWFFEMTQIVAPLVIQCVILFR